MNKLTSLNNYNLDNLINHKKIINYNQNKNNYYIYKHNHLNNHKKYPMLLRR